MKSHPRFFDFAALSPEPWGNGQGITRTIARGLDQAGAATWRVSLAQWDRASRFSLFAGFDRTLLAIGDDSVDLYSYNDQLIASPEQPVHFSGDTPIWVGMPAKPVRVINVMARRISHRTEVTVHRHSARVTLGSTHILFCVRGTWSLDSASLHDVSLKPMSGICLESQRESLDLEPDGTRAQIVSIAIDPLPY
jgi:environmental stress-induced protein Ves